MITGAPPPTSAVATVSQRAPHPPPPLLEKKLDQRMKNLEQLRQLQKLLEDGVLSHEEFDSQKKIVVQSALCETDSESKPLIDISLFPLL